MYGYTITLIGIGMLAVFVGITRKNKSLIFLGALQLVLAVGLVLIK